MIIDVSRPPEYARTTFLILPIIFSLRKFIYLMFFIIHFLYIKSSFLCIFIQAIKSLDDFTFFRIFNSIFYNYFISYLEFFLFLSNFISIIFLYLLLSFTLFFNIIYIYALYNVYFPILILLCKFIY